MTMRDSPKNKQKYTWSLKQREWKNRDQENTYNKS